MEIVVCLVLLAICGCLAFYSYWVLKASWYVSRGFLLVKIVLREDQKDIKKYAWIRRSSLTSWQNAVNNGGRYALALNQPEGMLDGNKIVSIVHVSGTAQIAYYSFMIS